MPAIATLTLFSAVGQWNNWTSAFYFFTDARRLPLPNILRRMVIFDTNADPRQNPAYQQMEQEWQRLVGGDRAEMRLFNVAVMNATIVVTALPIMLLYPFFQKYFAKGVLVGSVKG
jgi:putative aldouronate transport system permease protein